MKKLTRALLVAGSLGLGLLPAYVAAQEKGAAEAPARPDKAARKANKGEGKAKLKAVHNYYKGHMRLADHYMLGGDYGEAVNHFQAVIDYTPNLPAQADKADKADKAQDASRKGKRGKHGKRGAKLHKVKLNAYLGAAVASQRMGAAPDARRYAEAGLKYADANQLDKASKRFERFLADPATFAAEHAPEASALEGRLNALEKDLPAGAR